MKEYKLFFLSSFIDVPLLLTVFYITDKNIAFLTGASYDCLFIAFVLLCFVTTMYVFEQYNFNDIKIRKKHKNFFLSGITFFIFWTVVFSYLFIFLNITLGKWSLFYWHTFIFTTVFALVKLFYAEIIVYFFSKKDKKIAFFYHKNNAEILENKSVQKMQTYFSKIMLQKINESALSNKILKKFDFVILEDRLLLKNSQYLKHTSPNITSLSNFIEYNLEKLIIGNDFYNNELIKLSVSQATEIKRIHDIFTGVLNVFIVVLLIPIFVFFSVVIFCLNPFFNRGKLLYKQKRIGRNGEEFFVYKFRTMIANAEKDGIVMAQKNDTRITKLGRLLRIFRIDEIPQFFSILKGDMNFIGPRPERKFFVDKIASQEPFYHLRHHIKPGLSGWSQVKYKYGENIEDSLQKLSYDLYYIKNRNIVLDIRILLKTVSTVLFSKGI